MITKIRRPLLIFLFLTIATLSSCSPSQSFLLEYQSELRITEREDHAICLSQGINNGLWDEVTTEMYWRCRQKLVSDRKIKYPFTYSKFKHNKIINKISEEMIKNLNRAKSSAIAKIEEKIDLKDHDKCESLGNYLEKGKSNDNYYICRKNLVLDRIPPSPKLTHSYEAAAMPEYRSAEYLRISTGIKEGSREAVETANLMLRYQYCVGINIKSDDFKKCSAAAERSKQCLSQIQAVTLKKDLGDKIYCQKQAFIQFPDNYALAKDKSSQEIKEIEEWANKKRVNSALLYLEGKREMEDENDKIVKNDYGKSYNKIDLLKLREHFIFQCVKKMTEKLPEFAKKNSENCLSIAKNWANKNPENN
ncbi:MAG: hypothetical protein ACJAW3_000794 [Lentimonas sp.]